MSKIQVNEVRLNYKFHGSEDAPERILNIGFIMNVANSWIFQTKALIRSDFSDRYETIIA